MIKKYPLIFILFVVSLISHAQFNIYHPFPDSNAYWKESANYAGSPYGFCVGYGYIISGDTIVNGVVHYKLYRVDGVEANNCIGPFRVLHTRVFYGAIRQDSSKREYICCTAQYPYAKDSLLYDFGVKIGDTLNQYNTANYSWKSFVSSIDSILIDGNYRKQFVISAMYQHTLYQNTDSIVEGIGSMQGLVEVIQGIGFSEESDLLVCFQQNGNIVFGGYQNQFNDSCTVYGPLGINGLNNQIISFTISPNPASASVILSFHLQNKNSILSLYNSMGQLVKVQTISTNDKSITEDLSILPNGIYYYTLSVDGVVEATNKLAIIR